MTDFETKDDVWQYLRTARNWGRWGDDDQLGTLNLITPEKRRRAASLVRSGRIVSLARPFPTHVAANNPSPAQLFTTRVARGPHAGSVVDYTGISCHGTASTHIDALCHVWDEDGMWNGRKPDEEIRFDGVRFGDVASYGDGIATRGVLLDVPRHRGVRYVTQDRPVTGSELRSIADAQGVALEPGDALVVYSGREQWDRENAPWGTGSLDVGRSSRPGLHVSCLPFLREADAAVLVWDMMDLRPNGFDLAFAVHAAIWAFGLALVDNALLEPLADACAEEGRYEFQLCVAPLRIVGGTGSSVNPIALF
ncbi:MAG TPA: cyclase family protein [Gaiellaceae bacterium]|nr:cyclase family protein [Gaiellaceae bacterium]